MRYLQDGAKVIEPVRVQARRSSTGVFVRTQPSRPAPPVEGSRS